MDILVDEGFQKLFTERTLMLELLIASGLCLIGAALFLTAPSSTESSKGNPRRTAGVVVSAAGLICFMILPFIDRKPALPAEPTDALLERADRLAKKAKADLAVLEEYKRHPQVVPKGSYILTVAIPEDFSADVLKELLPLEFNDVSRTVLQTGKRYTGLDKEYALKKKAAFEKLGLKASAESME